MSRWFSIKPALTLKGRTFHGIRGWAGKPTHPPLLPSSRDASHVSYTLLRIETS
jgi:hypothetical protein